MTGSVRTAAGGPAAATRPPSSSTSWSANWPARVRSCMALTTVRSRSSRRVSTSSSTCCWWPTSRPVVGSSSSSTGACWARARASTARWRSPPLSESSRRAARPARSSWSSTEATISRSRRDSVPKVGTYGVRPISTYPVTVIPAGTAGFWGTMAMRLASSRRDRAATVASPTRIAPRQGTSPAMARSRVVLPDPLGPIRPSRALPGMSRVRSCSTGRPSRATDTPRSSMAVTGPAWRSAGPGRRRAPRRRR